MHYLYYSVLAPIALLASIDIFVVKHYFDPETAGFYGAVSAVSKIIFFLTASVTAVLLPSVKLKQSVKENRALFIKSLALIVALGGVTLAIFTLFSEQVVSGLMGSKYLVYANLLEELSVAMFLLSIAGVIIIYNLALRRYMTGIIIAISLMGVFGLFAINHSSLNDVADSLIISNVGVIVAFVVWHGWSLLSKSK